MSAEISISNIVLRNLRKEDLDDIIKIDSASIGYMRNNYFIRKFERIFGEDHQLLISLVATDHNRVVGYVMGEANTGEYGIPESVASVDTFGVHPDYKRVGIGALLLEEYCALAKKAGIELMTTLISEDYPDIVKFFKAQGFKQAKMIALDRRL
ncbi:GNAT family N-acetyltransferase [bacterium]|nr:GNAT family N-acetyltransferase [bacterium]